MRAGNSSTCTDSPAPSFTGFGTANRCGGVFGRGGSTTYGFVAGITAPVPPLTSTTSAPSKLAPLWFLIVAHAEKSTVFCESSSTAR